MTKLYDEMHNLMSVSKTLRFELEPIGKTEENFRKYLLDIEQERAEKFKNVKKYADEYHKIFIDECLSNFDGSSIKDLLKNYLGLFNKKEKTEAEQKQFETIQDNLRKIISECFTKNNKYEGLFGKDLITVYLPELYQNDKVKLDEISLFNNFTTYFTGYNTNRKNIYSKEEQSTAISYRLINENLPTFLRNIEGYQKLKEKQPDISQIIKDKLGLNPDDFLKV